MKLKSVLLGLLFSLVLIPSFSSAFENTFYPYVPVQINDGQNNILKLTDNVNFLLNDTYKVISVYGGGDYPRLKNVFWNGTGLYFIDSCAGGGSNCQNINTSIRKQGFIQKYYECTLNDSICNVSDTPLKDISEFIGNSNYSDPDYMFISDTRWNNSALFVCFKYSSLNSQICFDFDESLSYYSNSLGFTYNPKPSQYGDSNSQVVDYFSNSPFVGSSSDSFDPVSDIIFYSDNNQVYYDFLTLLGYNTGLCYGDFVLTEIVVLEGSYYQFFPDDVNTGANIFTLKNNWYSNFDNYSWYAQIRGLYNITTNSNDFSPYMGKSRGFYRLAYKVENQSYFSAYQPNGTDLFIYCDMALNGFNPNGLFTGNLSPSATNIFINSDYRNHYGENKDGNFVLSGANSYFSGEDVGLFDVFNRLYTRFRHGFTVNGSEDYRVGILPSFVVFGFFLMLLLYMFKR